VNAFSQTKDESEINGGFNGLKMKKKDEIMASGYGVKQIHKEISLESVLS